MMSVFNVGVAMFSSNTTILALDGAELAVNGSETKSVAVVEAALNPVAVVYTITNTWLIFRIA